MVEMIREHGFAYTADYYDLPKLLRITVILITLKNLILLIVCLSTGIRPGQGILFSLCRAAVNLLFFAVWGSLLLVKARRKRYHSLTGRDLYEDMRKYKRTFDELVEYFQDADVHRLDTVVFPRAAWKETEGIVFGTAEGRLITIPSASEGNIAVYGPPGSGKTSGIAIPNAMCFGGSVLAIDIKGDVFHYVSAHSQRKIIRFCPDAPNALLESCCFDPLAGLKEMSVTDRKLFLETMATVLIPDEGGSDGGYFVNRARKLFQGIAQLLYHDNPDLSFPELIHKILEGNVFDWVNRAMESKCIPAKEMLASFYGNNEKNLSGAYDALASALIGFSNPVLDVLLSHNANAISIDTLENGYDIYLQISQEHLDAYSPLFTLLIQIFSTAFTRRPDSSTGVKNRPILMLLDEFPQLTFSYKMINSNLSTLRSKSVICMIIQQNLSQLERRYQQDGMRSIIGNCNYQVILGSNDITSSKLFSEMLGTRKVLKISTSENQTGQQIPAGQTGRSVQECREPVIYPEDFGDLSSTGEMMLYFKGKYCRCERLNCYKT